MLLFPSISLSLLLSLARHIGDCHALQWHALDFGRRDRVRLLVAARVGENIDQLCVCERPVGGCVVRSVMI